eukprot:m.9052 g.9052  ORF g.9052 m.9052 type:complete len:696 (+) comp4133_c0_seq1:420-2507(+)
MASGMEMVGREKSSASTTSVTSLPGFGGGRYNTIKRLGAGNFGTCWLVQDTEDGMLGKVVKQMFIGGLSPNETVDALKEAKLLQSLKHPNVVGYYDAFVQEGHFVCIVMEYCDSGDLSMAVQRKSALGQNFTEDQIMEWTIQLLLALRYLHDRKILHRDIKTKNIFVKTPMGSSEFLTVVQLGDFGIARVLLNTHEEVQSLAGTPYYMSPECLKGVGYNSKSDVWSLACVVYELCLLEMPFKGDSLLTLTKLICDGELPTLPKWLSPATRTMFEAMLVRDAEARPTALDLLSMEACHPYFQSFNEALSDHLAKTLLKKDAARIHQASREASTAKHIAGVDSYEAYESAPPSSYGSREASWTQTSNPDAHLTPKQRLAAKKQRKADEEGARLRENAAAAQAEGARSRARNKNRANPESAGHWGGSTGKGPDHWITEHPDIFPGGYAPDSTTSTAGMATNKFSVFTAESPVSGMPAGEASKGGGTLAPRLQPLDASTRSGATGLAPWEREVTDSIRSGSVRNDLVFLQGEVGSFLDGSFKATAPKRGGGGAAVVSDPAPRRSVSDLSPPRTDGTPRRDSSKDYGFSRAITERSIYDPSEDRPLLDSTTTLAKQENKARTGLGKKEYTKVHQVLRRAYRKKATSEEVRKKLEMLARKRDGSVDGSRLRLFYVVEQIVAQELSEDAVQPAQKSNTCVLL